MRYRLLCSILFAMTVGSGGLSAQKQAQLFVSLTTADGKPVDGLTAAEVTITEDGKECKTLKVEPVAWPTRLQVLVDNGRSNTTPVNPLRDGLKEFFTLIPDGVEMSLYTTAATPRNIVKPTTDRQKLIDGIPLVSPDNGAGQFLDALIEASDRVAKEKMPGYGVIVMVGSDFGSVRALDRDLEKLQANIINYGITTHIVVHIGGQGGTTGGAQLEIGTNVSKMSGGRYDTFNTPTRLATLLPELAKQIAQSVALQSHQYRVSYERPAKPSDRPAIGASVAREGNVRISLHGNLP